MSVPAQEELLTPRAEIAQEFLNLWFGAATDGYIEIAWSDPSDGKLNNARHFSLGDQSIGAFAAKVSVVKDCNVYFCASTVSLSGDRRAKDMHFVQAPGCWLDQDTKAHIAQSESVVSILQPSAIVVTGRVPGVRRQQFYLTEEALTDPSLVRDLNARLVQQFGGDPAVVNPARLMRLPGTISWPTKAKLRKEAARVPELTECLLPANHRRLAFSLQVIDRNLPKTTDESPPPATAANEGQQKLSAIINTITSQKENLWHEAVRDLVAHKVGKGESDAEIHLINPAITWPGWSLEETAASVQSYIDGARGRWNTPDNPDQPLVDRNREGAEAFAGAPLPSMPQGYQDAGIRLYGIRDLHGLFSKRPEFVIDGFLVRGTIAMLTGLPGTGKSPLAHELCAYLIVGEPWMGRTVDADRIVCVTGESEAQTFRNILNGVRRLLEAENKIVLGEESPVSDEDVLSRIDHKFLMVKDGFTIERGCAKLVQALDEVCAPGGIWEGSDGPQVIFFDTLRSTAAGSTGKDEDMAIVSGELANLKRHCPKALILVIHHSPKGDPEASSGTNRLDGMADTLFNITACSPGSETPLKNLFWGGADKDGWRHAPARLHMSRNKMWQLMEDVPMMFSAREDSVRLSFTAAAENEAAHAFSCEPYAGDYAGRVPSMNEREAAKNATGYVGYVLLQAGRPLSSAEIIEALEKLPKIPPEVRVSLGLGKDAALRARYLNRHLMKLKEEGLVRLDGASPRTSKWTFVR